MLSTVRGSRRGRTYETRRKLAPGTNPRPVLVEKEGARSEDKPNEAQKRAGPVNAELGGEQKRLQCPTTTLMGATAGLTFVNIWTVNSGNAAATAERTMVLAANADALYILRTRREPKPP